MRSCLFWGMAFLCVFTLLLGEPSWAQAPEHWGTGLQPAATPVMHNIHSFFQPLAILMVGVCVFVLALLVYVIFRFNAKANPVPSKTSHNTFLEIVWTVIPVLIVVAICIPSFRLLYFQREIPKPDLVVKVTGNQWSWTYEYPDTEVEFPSIMKKDEELEPGDLRLLSVDNPLVVPAGKVVQILVTGSDVIHSWAVPSFGIKIDAIPGRLNEDWFKIEKAGIFYGQCSELCGKDHGFMPIEIHAVSPERFETWMNHAKEDGVEKANSWLKTQENPDS